MKRILGVDPGNTGAFAVVKEDSSLEHFFPMPLTKDKNAFDKKEIDIDEICSWFDKNSIDLLICELPTSYGMLPAGAFTYGYNFSRLITAFHMSKSAYKKLVYVRPSEWAKDIHKDMDKNLKAKAKSEMCFSELFGDVQFGKLNKGSIGGVKDAALIAEYGRRLLEWTKS